MNIKEWIIPVLLALVTTWFVQRFVVDKFLRPTSTQVDRAVGFIAPQVDQVSKPLHVNINFIDSEKKLPELRTEVVTAWGSAQFSSHGAVLHTLDVNHMADRKGETIRIIYPRSHDDRQTHCFLLALNEPTPFFYELVSHEEQEDFALISYKASFAHGTVLKTFKVHKLVYKIDLHSEIIHNGDGTPVEVRILYPSPFMADIAEREVVSALLINGNDTFEHIAWKDLKVDQGWFAPLVFGSADTYFMHAVCADPNLFIKRAYYKSIDKNTLVSILEGPTICESASWDLSFYCGPKSDSAVNAVDSRLEKGLGYAGFLAPISTPLSKLFLKILIFLFEYVGNYGVAIILLTLLLKLIMFPLTMRSDARMKDQQQMAREMQYLNQRYKDDAQRLAVEQAALIKKYGMPGIGCLPTLLQIPVLISMRTILANTIQLYHAPFLWIPDLSVRDPYYILPLLLVFSMFAQAATGDKTQRMVLTGVALVLGAVMAQLAAGLVLYFVVYGLLTTAQTYCVRRFNI